MAKNNDTVVGEIYETYDYGKFSFFDENRGMKHSQGYDKNRGQKLQRLINDGEYYNEIGIVKVNLDFKIIDGRHNFEVRRQNKLVVRYIIIKNEHFNVPDKKDLFAPINRINKHNSAWSIKNLFGSALNLKMPLALIFEELMKRHKYHFTWIDLCMVLKADIGILSTWSRSKMKPEMFDDHVLVERAKSKEFQTDFNLFVRINDKARVYPRKTSVITCLYNVIYKSNLVSSLKLVKAFEQMPDDKIKAFKGSDEFTRDLIRMYNSYHGEKINPEAVLMQIRNHKRGKEITIK